MSPPDGAEPTDFGSTRAPVGPLVISSVAAGAVSRWSLPLAWTILGLGVELIQWWLHAVVVCVRREQTEDDATPATAIVEAAQRIQALLRVCLVLSVSAALVVWMAHHPGQGSERSRWAILTGAVALASVLVGAGIAIARLRAIQRPAKMRLR